RTDLRQFCEYLASDAGRSTASTGGGAPPVKIQTVDTRQVRGWLASLHGRGLDAASIARKLAAVRSWMRFLARRWHLERNPARGAARSGFAGSTSSSDGARARAESRGE